MISLLAHLLSQSHVSKLVLFLSFPVFSRSSYWQEGGGEEVMEVPNIWNSEKAWSSIIHSILSGLEEYFGTFLYVSELNLVPTHRQMLKNSPRKWAVPNGNKKQKMHIKGAQAWEFFARVFCSKQTHLGMWLRVWEKKSIFLSNDPWFRKFMVFCRILSVW